MNKSFIFLWITTVVWNAAARVPFQEDLDINWENFKRAFNKKYESNEEEARRLIWEQNVNRIGKHNLDYNMGRHTYQLGINKYSDMTREEKVRTMTGLKVSSEISETKDNRNFYFYSIPESVDWRQKGVVTPVKDQGQCGSCWAFSSTGCLESQHKIITGQLVSLSEQNLIDCSSAFGNHGCAGGIPTAAFLYVAVNGGIDKEASYPYEGKENVCRFKNSTIGATALGAALLLPKGNETVLQFAVFGLGPMSVGMNASLETFLSYKGGIYNDPNCDGSEVANLNHAVLVVGYGSENGQDFWIVKNSWGTSWGEEGYIRIARNQRNICGIATYLTFPTS